MKHTTRNAFRALIKEAGLGDLVMAIGHLSTEYNLEGDWTVRRNQADNRELICVAQVIQAAIDREKEILSL